MHEAQRAHEKLSALGADSFEALYKLKFYEFGYHPLTGQPLNLIEQLNQTFTILASFVATRHVLTWFPEVGGLRLNLGTTSGPDIQSIGAELVEAEVFAAVNPNNNRKLQKDIDRMASSSASHRYVFFHSPRWTPGRKPEYERDGVEVWVVGELGTP